MGVGGGTQVQEPPDGGPQLRLSASRYADGVEAADGFGNADSHGGLAHVWGREGRMGSGRLAKWSDGRKEKRWNGRMAEWQNGVSAECESFSIP